MQCILGDNIDRRILKIHKQLYDLVKYNSRDLLLFNTVYQEYYESSYLVKCANQNKTGREGNILDNAVKIPENSLRIQQSQRLQRIMLYLKKI